MNYKLKLLYFLNFALVNLNGLLLPLQDQSSLRHIVLAEFVVGQDRLYMQLPITHVCYIVSHVDDKLVILSMKKGKNERKQCNDLMIICNC